MTTLVPAVLQMILESPEIDAYDVSTLDTIACAASPISPELLRRCLAVFEARFLQIYGLTETQGATNLLPEDHLDPDHPERLLSVGRAMPGVTLRVVDAITGEDLPDDVVGEVWIKAPTNMHGYWANAEASREVLTQDGFVRTGDGASLRDGYVYLRDRLKDMIVSGAENIYPIEIENVLIEHPDISDVAVIGVPSERWGETVKAMVVLRKGARLSESEVIGFARSSLAAYKCPTSVEFIGELPRNRSGKILKRVLRPLLGGRRASYRVKPTTRLLGVEEQATNDSRPMSNVVPRISATCADVGMAGGRCGSTGPACHNGAPSFLPRRRTIHGRRSLGTARCFHDRSAQWDRDFVSRRGRWRVLVVPRSASHVTTLSPRERKHRCRATRPRPQQSIQSHDTTCA
jgi:hypothetical protein